MELTVELVIEGLTAIDAKIHQAANLLAGLDAAVEGGRQILQCDRCLIYQFLPQGDGVVIAEAVGTGWTPILGQLIYDPCFSDNYIDSYRQGRVSKIVDLFNSGLNDCYVQLLANFQVQANLVIPILLSQPTTQLWGLLIAHQCDGPRQWRSLDITVLQHIAVQLGMALHHNHQQQAQRQQQAICALPDTQTHYLNLINHLNDGFVVHRLDTSISLCNESACNLLGLSMDQMLGKTAIDPVWHFIREDGTVMPPEEYPVRRVLATGKPLKNYVLGIIRSAQAPVWVLVNSFPEFDAQGQIQQVVVTFIDITERKQIENDIQRTRNFLQTLLDHLPIAIFVKDARPAHFGQFRFFNRASERLFGLTAAQVIGKTDYDFFPAEQAEHFTRKDREVMERGTVEDIPEEVIDSHSLGRRWLHTVKAPIYDQQQPQYLLGISEDITDRKQTEAALKLSQTKFEALVTNMPGMVYRYFPHTPSQTHRFTFVSPHAYELLELSPETILANADNFINLIHPEDLSAFLVSVSCAVEHFLPWYWEGRIVTPSGQLKWIQGSSQAQHSPEGAAWDGLLVDITDRKQAEAFLRQQTQRERLVRGITDRIRCSLDIDQILSTTVNEIRHALAADRVLIFRFSPDWSGQVTHESVAEGWNSLQFHRFTDSYFVETQGQEYVQGRLHTIADIYTAPLSDCHLEFLEQIQVRAKAVIPILIEQERLWGLLVAHHCAAPHSWQSWEVDLLQQLANQVGIAIHQANLYQQVQQLNQSLEEQVQERTAQLQMALSATNMGTWEWDLATHLERWSTQTYGLMGYQVDQQGNIFDLDGQAVNTPPSHNLFLSHVHPDDLEHLERVQTQSLREQAPFEYEFRFVWSDGSIHWCYTRGAYIFDAHGQPLRAVGICMDISERKRQEAERKQAEIQIQQQAQRDRSLQLITELIHQSLNLDETLSATLNQVRVSMKADRVAVYRFEPNWSGQFVAEARGEEWVPLVGPDIERVWEDTYLQTTAGGRYKNHETFTVTDIYAADLARCHLDLLEQFQARAYAIVPIFVRDFLWGLLAAYQNSAPRQWQAQEVDMLEQVAVRMAIAIQQSDLYQQIRVQLNERIEAEAKLHLSLREKEMLLKEIHHRVKNNLQIVSSLLMLQCDTVEDPQVLKLFQESQDRINAIAMIHEHLYQSSNLAQVNLKDYIESLVKQIVASIGNPQINIHLSLQPISLNLETALPCGLLINRVVGK